jgi:hypothetical protein
MAIRGKWKIKLSTVPDSIPVHQYIFEKTDFLAQCKKFNNYFDKDFVTASLNCNFNHLANDIKESLEIYGTFPFSYKNKSQDTSYTSVSLNFNSNSIDKVSNNPHQGILGSSIGSYKSINNYKNNLLGKNTYNDTFSFTERTDCSNYKGLGVFLNSLKRSMIRSRISILHGSNSSIQDISYGWHNDELIFLNLRVNVPIQSTENYYIQILNDQVLEHSQISEFNLKTGQVYAYDTHKYHRACCKKLERTPRINLILGVSPWFDFDKENNQWISNEFYGDAHPFEMLQEQLITNLIGK